MMTDKCNKVIHLNGPSLGGKTRLAYKLSEFLSENGKKVGNISFELLYNKIVKNYEYEFSRLIESKISDYDVIIAESVLFYNYNYNNAFHILCLPAYEQHLKAFQDYKKEYGKEALHKRVYFDSVEKLRDDFFKKYKNKLAHYTDGNDIENLNKLVLDYVNDR